MFYKDSDVSDFSLNSDPIDDIEKKIIKLRANKPGSTTRPTLYINYERKFQEMCQIYADEAKDYGDMIASIKIFDQNIFVLYADSFFQLEISKIFVALLKSDFEIQNVKIILSSISAFLFSYKQYVENFVEAGLIPALFDRLNSEMFIGQTYYVFRPLIACVECDQKLKDIIIPNVDLDMVFDYLHTNSQGPEAKNIYFRFLKAAISHHDATEEQMAIYIKHLCIFFENWEDNRSIIMNLLFALTQYVFDFGSYEALHALADPFQQMVRQSPLIDGLFSILKLAADELYNKQQKAEEMENTISPDAFDFGLKIGNTEDISDDQEGLADTQKQEKAIKRGLLVGSLDVLAIIFEAPVEIEFDPQMFLILLDYDDIDVRTEILLLIGNIFESMPEAIESFFEAHFFDYLSDVILLDNVDNRTKMEAAICLCTAICMSNTSVRLNFATCDYLTIFFELLFSDSNPQPYMIARGFRFLLETINLQFNSEKLMEMFTEIDGFTLPEVKQLWQHNPELIEEVELVEKLINSIMENES